MTSATAIGMRAMVALLRCASISCALLLASGSAWAADPVRHELVALAQGAPLKKLSGKIKGYESVEYSFAVPADAALTVKLNSANRSAYFNVSVAGADEPLFIGSRDGDSFHGTAPAERVYKVRVYLMRNAARRNAVAAYVLAAGVGKPETAR